MACSRPQDALGGTSLLTLIPGGAYWDYLQGRFHFLPLYLVPRAVPLVPGAVSLVPCVVPLVPGVVPQVELTGTTCREGSISSPGKVRLARI